MGAFLDNGPLVHHEDAVGLQHSGEAVRDDQRRAVLHDIFQRRLHQNFVLGVERGGRLVEQQYGSVLQDGARNGEPLALAARQGHPALADGRVISLVEMADEFGRRRALGGGLDLLHRRGRAAVADVFGNAGTKDRRILRHQREAGTQLRGVNLANVDAIERHRSRLGIVETHQQLEHGRLSGTRRTDNSHRLTRCHTERQGMQRRCILSRRIGETDGVEHHLPTSGSRQDQGRHRCHNFRPDLQDLGDAARRASRRGNFAPNLRELAQRARAEDRVKHKL